MLNIDRRNFIRLLSVASLSGGAIAVGPSASAAPVPIPGILTLQELIDTGNTGIIIGDKQFYHFTYTESPLASGSPPPANPGPTGGQISVMQPDVGVEGF